ncbi:MAG: peptide deformylase [Patescibacteria group bacterium]
MHLMTQKAVLTSPNMQLRVVSKEFTSEDFSHPDTIQLAQDLIETMKLENGIGIAAPQVGIHKRMIIVTIAENDSRTYINPKIISSSFLTIESEEGCLSVPGVFGIVKRHRAVTVTAQDLNGNPLRFRAVGLTAIVFQHEIDHLNGVLFIDKVIRFTTHPTL